MRTLRWFVVLALLPCATLADGLKPEVADERQVDAAAIKAHIDSIFQAYIRKDRDRIRATHSTEWRGFLRPSRDVVKGIDAYMQAAEAALSGPYGLAGYEFKEYDVVFYGDMAIVNYVAALVPGRGIPFRPMIRVLDVYALDGDHWMQVASQTTRHPDTNDALRQQPSPVNERLRGQILEAREQVWRAWFENREELAQVIPTETIAINPGEEAWQDREEILNSAREFADSGGKLVHLTFPRTEIQLFGDVAILYTTYELGTESDGKRTDLAGRGTEIFIRRAGRWVNAGWHLDSGS